MKQMLGLLLMLIVLALSSCGNNVQSVDLSQVTFEGVSVGGSFGLIDTDKYTVKQNASSDYTYNYEEWRISVDNGVITEIMASFGQVYISINGKEDCRSVDNIIAILGESYNSSWYDREQSLRQIQYFDEENGIQCTFVYDKNSSNLVWGIEKNI